MLLAADIGGTKIHLALYDNNQQHSNRAAPLRVTQGRYASAEFDCFAPVLRRFLDKNNIDAHAVKAFCAGVAGPVMHEVAHCPNLGWTVTCAEVRKVLPKARVELINDLVANGLGLAALGDDEWITVQAGDPPPHGNALAALISAGTGLGMAALQPVNDGWLPWPSEGGHADFAPRGEEQMELLRFAEQRHGWPINVDHLVSGPGLRLLYDFCAHHRQAADAEVARRIAQNPDQASALISEAALTQSCPTCAQALRLFVEIYASTAANLALTLLTQGGVFVGGGIAPKILPALLDGRFTEHFAGSGRHRSLLQSIPIAVVTNADTALWGAARQAREMV